MNIKIGAIIKRLRAENNITQDALATAIGVTPQAISRWEAEGGYPDIELLPSLADFFSVSTDELLGYKLSQREKEIADIKKEISRLSEVGRIDERIAFARDAISRFPADFEIKEGARYVRISIRDKFGHWADPRGFFPDELGLKNKD